jgi:Hypothetical protein (DUF2513)
MQRNVDLLRQLLLEIERRGAASSIDSLPTDAQHGGDERVRYHLRLLTDAGLLKEAGQTAAGVPCVRLTHAGQEFIELARSDARWREAKAAILASSGGVPLAVLRSLLLKRAWQAAVRHERRRAIIDRRRYRRYLERMEPNAWLDAYATDPDTVWDENEAQVVRDRTSRRQRAAAAWESDLYSDVAAELAENSADASLPEHLI